MQQMAEKPPSPEVRAGRTPMGDGQAVNLAEAAVAAAAVPW